MLSVRYLTKMRGVHGLAAVAAVALFWSANIRYGLALIDDSQDSPRSYASEVSISKKLELEKLFVARRPYARGSWTQGFTVTRKYFVVVTTIKDGDNILTAYDKKTFRKKLEVKCSIGHGNDLAYNSDTNEIVTFGGRKNEVKFFDADTLREKKSRTLTIDESVIPVASANSLTYNAADNRYYIISPTVGGRVFTSDFKELDMNIYTASPFNLHQTLTYHKGRLFYARGCQVWSDGCAESDEMEGGYMASTGSVTVYNAKTGQMDCIFYIPATNAQGRYYGELEGVSVDEKNNMYFLYASYRNEYPSIGDNGTFVIFRLPAENRLAGNSLLKMMLNTKADVSVIDSGLGVL